MGVGGGGGVCVELSTPRLAQLNAWRKDVEARRRMPGPVQARVRRPSFRGMQTPLWRFVGTYSPQSITVLMSPLSPLRRL